MSAPIGLLSLSNLIALAVPVLAVTAIIRARRQPLWAEAYRRLRRNKIAIAAMLVIATYAGIGLLDSIAWQDSKASDSASILDRLGSRITQERTYSAPLASVTTGEPHSHPVVGRHPLGTDGSGRDVLFRTLKGCRTAMMIGGLSTLILVPIALITGLSAGYFGRRIDDAVQFIFTVVGSVPDILMLVALLLVLGKGVPQICMALGFTGWIGLCRLLRGETLKHRDLEYVRAARALGMSDARILSRHILPNLLPLVIVSITLGFSGLVLSETVLTYLQIGVPPNMGSWGNMIDGARLELAREPIIWWNLTAATTALFALVLAFNILGDALRDAIDPRLRSS